MTVTTPLGASSASTVRRAASSTWTAAAPAGRPGGTRSPRGVARGARRQEPASSTIATALRATNRAGAQFLRYGRGWFRTCDLSRAKGLGGVLAARIWLHSAVGCGAVGTLGGRFATIGHIVGTAGTVA